MLMITNHWIISKYVELKHLSILSYQPLTLLPCRADYMAFTGNKPLDVARPQAAYLFIFI